MLRYFSYAEIFLLKICPCWSEPASFLICSYKLWRLLSGYGRVRGTSQLFGESFCICDRNHSPKLMLDDHAMRIDASMYLNLFTAARQVQNRDDLRNCGSLAIWVSSSGSLSSLFMGTLSYELSVI